MHIPEGVLGGPVLAVGAVVAAAGIGVGLRSMTERDTVKVGVLSAAFFVGSLIHVPLGPASVHLVLNGLAGLLLGWSIFPAMAVALLLQAVIFGVGGLTTLGVNTVILASPGLCCYFLFHKTVRSAPDGKLFVLGFACGALAIFLGAGLLSATLVTAGKEFRIVAGAVYAAHVPVALIEGAVTGAAVSFLRKVRPETFTGDLSAALPAQEGAQ